GWMRQPLPGSGFPDARLGLYAGALGGDHARRTTQLVFHPALAAAERARLIALFNSDATPVEASPFALLTPFWAEQDAEQYRQAILRIQEYIHAVDCYQVNYPQRFSASCDGN